MKLFLSLLLVPLFWKHDGSNSATASRNMFNGDASQFAGIDVSSEVFGDDNSDVFPVAYFDVNADKLTDIVAVSRERTSINIFLAADQPPYLRRAFHPEDVTKVRGNEDRKIVSVRPGDFTGNGLADLMVTLGKDANETGVNIMFCSLMLTNRQINGIQCGSPGTGAEIKNLTQEPFALDLNGDTVLDLLGEKWTSDGRKTRMIWLSERTKDSFQWIEQPFQVIGPWHDETSYPMTKVSSNAFGDIDGDGVPELTILTQVPQVNTTDKVIYFLETYQVVKDSQEITSFQFKQPPEYINTFSNLNETQIMGQPMLVDFEHNGVLQQLYPYCSDLACASSGIYVIDQGNAYALPLAALTYQGDRWGFIPPPKHPNKLQNLSMEHFYSHALSFRVGDFNLDGYPDLLGVLKTESKSGPNRVTRAVLFENVVCSPSPEYPCHYNRTFSANFEIFKDYTNVISASFYDIGDNGALDMILVMLHKKQQAAQLQRFEIRAFQNEMNFDASFLKVMVLTGQPCLDCEGGIPYGNVLPGATVRYTSLNTQGVEESGLAIQTYRTSHMTLDLPCTVFGIGHSPNFIEALIVTIAPDAHTVPFKKKWKQIIPNSQIVVVPNPLERPDRWTMKLFLTPSDVVLKAFGILVAVCLVLATLVAALEFKERLEDKKARQSEAHRMILWWS